MTLELANGQLAKGQLANGQSTSSQLTNGQLSFVNATGTGCQIHRETTGRYVVSHPGQPRARVWAATLAGAYAACRTWELSGRLLDPAI